MKTTLFCIIISIFLISGTFAQSSESEIAKEFYKADANINIVINYLPKGWNFSAVNDQFIVKSSDTVYSLEENRINAVPEKKEDQVKRIKASGKRIIPEIVIHYEDKWTIDKIQQAKIENAAINDAIRELPAKYKITGLSNKKTNPKEQTVYTATNDKEKYQIQQYEKEKSQLLGKMIKIPDFHSQKYSLFIVSTQGNNDDMHIVYPDEPSLELYTILSTFREICGK